MRAIQAVSGVPDPLVEVRIRILPLSSKNSKKAFLLFCDSFYDFLSVKNDAIVAPSKSNKQKFVGGILKVMTKRAGSGSVSQRYGSADPVTYQNITDPEHCIAGNQKETTTVRIH